MKNFWLVCLLAVSFPAEAAVFKCLVNGKTVYSDSPCPKNSSAAQVVEIIDNTIDSREARRAVANNKQGATNRDRSANVVEFMSKHDINLRVKELKSAINAITSPPEKVEASKRELFYITSKQPRKLTYENETMRSEWRRDLGSIQRDVRIRAESELDELYRLY